MTHLSQEDKLENDAISKTYEMKKISIGLSDTQCDLKHNSQFGSIAQNGLRENSQHHSTVPSSSLNPDKGTFFAYDTTKKKQAHK